MRIPPIHSTRGLTTGKLKIVYPVCCGMDVRRDFVIASHRRHKQPGHYRVPKQALFRLF